MITCDSVNNNRAKDSSEISRHLTQEFQSVKALLQFVLLKALYK